MDVSIITRILATIIVFLILSSVISVYGQQANTSTTNRQNYHLLNFDILKKDREPPQLNITSPIYPPTITTDKIIINGTSSDSGSGVLNVTAVAHTFPFRDTFPIPLASKPVPLYPNNWSKWSVPFIINDTNTYRVVITAVDKAGNPNYAETTINAPISEKNDAATVKKSVPKIAFIRPTFTEAAYQEHGFYRFYFKYGFPTVGKNITTDLDMLTVKTPKSVSEFEGNNIRYLTNITSLIPTNGTELSDVSQNQFPLAQKFWLPFIENVKKVVPDSIVTVMRDEDVHDGHLFYQGKTNAYDILLLLHNEYVTQAEYDNLRQFVKNGGTIVFIDANALYAEVRYDHDNGTMTLVKGHDWKFDGKSASRSVPERWYNETKEWVGSNFLINEINENITFANNPFNYTHFEEQFVNNPKDKIIMDYGIKFPKEYVDRYLKKEKLPVELHREDIPIENITIASYSMKYGHGKVIALGLSSRLLSDNPEFLRFFDNSILPKALCPKFQSCTYFPVTHYLYGCTDYKYVGYHCDPITNEFKSTSILSNYSKVASATREPSYVQAKFGKGIKTSGAHGLESLRANSITAYDADQFSIYISYMPDRYDETLGNPYMSLVSYKNGIYKRDVNNAGWEIELVPNNDTETRKIHFTVFDTAGNARSTDDVDIPASKFSEIAGTFDGKAVRIFVNGILKSEKSFSGNYSGHIDKGNFLKLGGDAYCSCYLASGIIDDVRYYNYTLDNERVKQINSSLDSDRGIVAYWNLNGNLKDYSRFKNDMFYNTLISSMVFAPDGRLFFAEKNSGNIRIMVNNTVLERPFASIPNIHVDFEQGLLGLAIDSKFKNNHFLFAYYNYEDEKNGAVYARIVRFTDKDNSGSDNTVILDRIPASSSGFHTGGALAFNKEDDKLYATIGDGIDAKSAQNISSLKGKIIRISRDGNIPGDNPFSDSPVYNYGHRNMFGIAFDGRGNGIVTEPGSALYDEINPQIKGGNYGWRTVQLANMPPNPLANDSSIKPLRSYYVAENPTQATYYDGNKYGELKGKFIVGSFRGDLFAYRISEDGKKLLEEIRINTSNYPSKEVVATAVSPSGDIYFGAYDIFRLGKIDQSSIQQIMFPVQINSTGINVLSLNYSEHTKEITVHLSKKYGFSIFSIKIPKSIIDLSDTYGCYSKSDSTSDQIINTEVPSQIGIQRGMDYNIVTIRPSDDGPKNLTFTINAVADGATQTKMCLFER